MSKSEIKYSTDLKEWLVELRKEVIGLFHNLYLFKFTRDTVLLPNKDKGLDTTYLLWILNSSTTDMVVTVGRFCDVCGDSKSMVKFLHALKKKDGGRAFKVVDIDKDISRLTSEAPCSKIIQFRNDYVAHTAKAPRPNPTYDELFKAFEVISDVMKKYQVVILGHYTGDFTPTIQGNWQTILTKPWVTPRIQRTSL